MDQKQFNINIGVLENVFKIAPSQSENLDFINYLIDNNPQALFVACQINFLANDDFSSLFHVTYHKSVNDKALLNQFHGFKKFQFASPYHILKNYEKLEKKEQSTLVLEFAKFLLEKVKHLPEKVMIKSVIFDSIELGEKEFTQFELLPNVDQNFVASENLVKYLLIYSNLNEDKLKKLLETKTFANPKNIKILEDMLTWQPYLSTTVPKNLVIYKISKALNIQGRSDLTEEEYLNLSSFEYCVENQRFKIQKNLPKFKLNNEKNIELMCQLFEQLYYYQQTDYLDVKDLKFKNNLEVLKKCYPKYCAAVEKNKEYSKIFYQKIFTALIKNFTQEQEFKELFSDTYKEFVNKNRSYIISLYLNQGFYKAVEEKGWTKVLGEKNKIIYEKNKLSSNIKDKEKPQKQMFKI